MNAAGSDVATGPAVRASAPRILGYDLARSVAILGMVIVHFALVMASDLEQPPWLGVVVDHLDGRAAALFVVLAGVGLTLRSRGAAGDKRADERVRVRRVVLRRGAFLLAVGVANLVLWPGDILRVYGVGLLLAAWLLNARGRFLLGAAALFVAGFVVLAACLDYEKNWEWETLTYRRLWTGEGFVRNLFFDGFRSVFPWAGLLFFGMWLGRRDGSDPATARRMLLRGGAAALLAEGVSNLLVRHFLAHPGELDGDAVRALFGTHSMPPLPLFLLSACGTAVAVVGASLLVAGRFQDNPLVRALVATGQMAFTWYVAHIYLGLGAVLALGLDKKAPLPVAAATGVGFFAAAVVSLLWKRSFRHGPVEGLMRRVAG